MCLVKFKIFKFLFIIYITIFLSISIISSRITNTNYFFFFLLSNFLSIYWKCSNHMFILSKVIFFLILSSIKVISSYL